MLLTGLPLYFVPISMCSIFNQDNALSWHISSNGSSSTACPVKIYCHHCPGLICNLLFYFGRINLRIDICKNRLCATIQGTVCRCCKGNRSCNHFIPSVTLLPLLQYATCSCPIAAYDCIFCPCQGTQTCFQFIYLSPQVR